MPNYVSNILEIYCPGEKTMCKIKKVIFDSDNEDEKTFSMQYLLPRPKGFSEPPDYSHYGYDWSYAIWGTKWDVSDYNIIESGDTIMIYYSTAWSPNYKWGESLCDFIQQTLPFEKSKKVNSIYINHRFYDYQMDFGGIMEWQPYSKPEYKSYSFMEYAKLHDIKLYETMILLEKRMSQDDTENYPIKNLADNGKR